MMWHQLGSVHNVTSNGLEGKVELKISKSSQLYSFGGTHYYSSPCEVTGAIGITKDSTKTIQSDTKGVLVEVLKDK